MSDSHNFIYQDYGLNSCEQSAQDGYGNQTNLQDGPVNFYTQPNYNPPQIDKIWTVTDNGNRSGNEYWVVNNSTNQGWTMQPPTVNCQQILTPQVPQHRVLYEQNRIAPVCSPLMKNNQVPAKHAAVITHTNEYKEMIENRDPAHQPLDRNWNASTKRVESETTIATNNLTNVLNAEENLESNNTESSNKRTTRSSRVRIFKRGGQDSMTRANNTELIQMTLKGSAMCESRGPGGDDGLAGGDGEPPVKVQKILQSDGADEMLNKKQDEKYQVSSNVKDLPSLQPKHIISWYIDHLIGENEEITEMSKSFTIPVNIFGSDDFYYMDSLQKKTTFPTPKFLQWMKSCFPGININVNAIDFYKKNGQGVRIADPKRYWQEKSPHDIIKEVFYHFQEQRLLG